MGERALVNCSISIVERMKNSSLANLLWTIAKKITDAAPKFLDLRQNFR